MQMKCLKCQNDAFDKNIIIVGCKNSPKEARFEIHNCNKCYLTQWYYQYIDSDEREAQKIDRNTIYKVPPLKDFQCENCHSKQSIIKIIKPSRSTHILKQIDYEGEILSRICSSCGLTEMYEIMLTGGYAQVDEFDKRVELAKSFICPVCTSKAVSQTGTLSFRLQQLPSRKYYLFGTCIQCKYIAVFVDI